MIAWPYYNHGSCELALPDASFELEISSTDIYECFYASYQIIARGCFLPGHGQINIAPAKPALGLNGLSEVTSLYFVSVQDSLIRHVILSAYFTIEARPVATGFGALVFAIRIDCVGRSTLSSDAKIKVVINIT